MNAYMHTYPAYKYVHIVCMQLLYMQYNVQHVYLVLFWCKRSLTELLAIHHVSILLKERCIDTYVHRIKLIPQNQKFVKILLINWKLYTIATYVRVYFKLQLWAEFCAQPNLWVLFMRKLFFWPHVIIYLHNLLYVSFYHFIIPDV